MITTTNTANREYLEELALKECSAENFYDLANDIELMTEQELERIIDCHGDYDKELEGNPTFGASTI